MATTVKILQINTNHSISATEHLKITIDKIQPNIIAIQEPYCFKNKIIGFSLTHHIIQYNEQPRAATIVRDKEVDLFPETITRDLISLTVTTRTTKIRIINTYKSPTEDIRNVLHTIEGILTTRENLPTVILGDFNAKHQAWGGASSDSSGDILAQFAINHSLFILNDSDQGPTYSSTNGNSYIDLTLTNDLLFPDIFDWEILNTHSESDHKYILTTCFAEPMMSTKRLTKKGEIKLLEHIKNDRWMLELKGQSITTKEKLIYILTQLYVKIHTYISKFSKIVKQHFKALIWWNADLEIERKKLGALRKRYQRCTNNTRHTQEVRYKSALHDYKKHIKEAKTTSWHNFCTEVSNTNIFSIPFKIATKKIKHPILIPPITDSHGIETQTLEESIQLILDYHFPEDKTETYSEQQKTTLSLLNEGNNTEDDVPFTETELSLILTQLAPRISPGTDQLTTNVVKAIVNNHKILVLNIFNACLRFSFYPDVWKTSRVILIPKKDQGTNEPRNYRPICISSIFGKILEKLVKNRIYYFLYHNNLHHSLQYGFTHGKSSTTALYNLKEKILCYQRENKKCILISLDISNAFNSIWLPFILLYFKKVNLPSNIYSLLKEIFCKRPLVYTLTKENITKIMTMGCPQGSPLSPLMWNVLL